MSFPSDGSKAEQSIIKHLGGRDAPADWGRDSAGRPRHTCANQASQESGTAVERRTSHLSLGQGWGLWAHV